MGAIAYKGKIYGGSGSVEGLTDVSVTDVADGDILEYDSETEKWKNSDALSNKVDKVTGKGLSTNDFTTEEKNKLSGIEAGAQVNPTIDSVLSDSSTNPVQNKVVKGALDNKAGREEIPSVNDNTITIQLNGVTVESFKLNQATDETINIQVTKSSVGLGNVPNVSTNDQTPTFTQASTRANIASGEKLSVIFGKIMKWFADLKTVAFSGSYNDLSDKPTIPSAANNGTLTIKQNGTSKGTFTANQSGNSTVELTDTTYESKTATSGGTAVSLVTTGEKYTWNNKSNFSGSYPDLTNKPTIPTKVSQLTNDSGYTTNTGTVTQVKVGNTAYNPSSGVISLPAYPTDTNTHRPIQVNGTEILGNNTTALNLKAGSNVSLSNSSGTVTIAATDTDTKNTAGTTNTTSKIFLAGATSQAANPQTYSNVNCYASGGKLYSNAKEVVNLSDSQALTNKTYNGYTLAAACAKNVATTGDDMSFSGYLPTTDAVVSYLNSNLGVVNCTKATNVTGTTYVVKVFGMNILIANVMSTAVISNATIFTIPSGYRPSSAQTTYTYQNNSTARTITVNTNGTVVGTLAQNFNAFIAMAYK